MRRLLAGLTAPLLVATLLTGCSEDPEQPAAEDSPAAEQTEPSEPSESSPSPEQPSDGNTTQSDAPGAGTPYCELLGTDLAMLFSGIQGPEDVEKAIGVIEEIAREAPPAVEDEWQVMHQALDQVEEGLTAAARLQKRAAEGKVSEKQLRSETKRLTEEMEALNTPANAEAGDEVARHASEYCGLALG